MPVLCTTHLRLSEKVLTDCLVVVLGTNWLHLISCVIISNISNFLSLHLNIRWTEQWPAKLVSSSAQTKLTTTFGTNLQTFKHFLLLLSLPSRLLLSFTRPNHHLPAVYISNIPAEWWQFPAVPACCWLGDYRHHLFSHNNVRSIRGQWPKKFHTSKWQNYSFSPWAGPLSSSVMMTNENHQENKPLTPMSNLSGNSTDLNTNIDLGLLGLCIGTSDLYFYGATVSLSFLT